MRYEKADDISYVDLKEACQIFNKHERLLGARINLRRKGFDYLMTAFIKAVTAVPDNRRVNIPEEVIDFYQALPAECFEAANVAVPSSEPIACASDGIPEFDPQVSGTGDELTAAGRNPVVPISFHEKRKSGPVPMIEGKMKARTIISLMKLIGHLEDLVAALKNGRIYIVSKNRVVIMKPGTLIQIRIEAGNHTDKHAPREQLTIKLEWVRDIVMNSNTDRYSISSDGYTAE